MQLGQRDSGLAKGRGKSSLPVCCRSKSKRCSDREGAGVFAARRTPVCFWWFCVCVFSEWSWMERVVKQANTAYKGCGAGDRSRIV